MYVVWAFIVISLFLHFDLSEIIAFAYYTITASPLQKHAHYPCFTLSKVWMNFLKVVRVEVVGKALTEVAQTFTNMPNLETWERLKDASAGTALQPEHRSDHPGHRLGLLLPRMWLQHHLLRHPPLRGQDQGAEVLLLLWDQTQLLLSSGC